ncbi:MAG: hypothetical protein VX498_15510, partial [Myxococcota bacterium]|nr:hypothetical protein [Myxococcota bacterium]
MFRCRPSLDRIVGLCIAPALLLGAAFGCGDPGSAESLDDVFVPGADDDDDDDDDIAPNPGDDDDSTPPSDPDNDGDGFPASLDCDDEDPLVHPEAIEVPYDGTD